MYVIEVHLSLGNRNYKYECVNMTSAELIDLLKSGDNISLIAMHIGAHPELVETLMSITLKDGPDSSWRTAWTADKIHEHHPELIVPYLPSMIDFAVRTLNSGKKRHLLKLISLHDIPDEKMALLLNHCIQVFSDATEAIAVRVHAMQILFRIAEKEPGFTGELIGLIEHEIEFHGSAGIASRGRKLLKKLCAMEKSGFEHSLE